ncbi:MAG: glycosyltransferase family 2 protein [Patescibacteria group bacterium]|nr:glycosyltransferase family 2 protein [Patescibacteria group bacterium]
MHSKKVFCVIPAYNEEKNIKKVISEVAPLVHSLVVVVDGVGDRTLEEAKEAKNSAELKNTNVYILKHIINRGQGAALQTGDDFALNNGADVVVHFDADGQFLSTEIEDMSSAVVNGDFDVVFGSRFLGKESNMPFFKKQVIMRLGRFVNRIFLGLELSDPQNGFRVVNKKALQLIKIEQDGSAHCSEILAKTAKNGLRYKEVAVTVRYYDYGQGLFSGKGRGKGGFIIIKDLILGKFIN